MSLYKSRRRKNEGQKTHSRQLYDLYQPKIDGQRRDDFVVCGNIKVRPRTPVPLVNSKYNLLLLDTNQFRM